MPLQNRVRPDGEIVATSQRGLFLGNRGGAFHNPETKSLHPTKRWASKQWICCTLDFKDRKRELMGDGYTELFFCDEVTALAAGHRPCFECRRKKAIAFADAWAKTKKLQERPKVRVIDEKLHEERLTNGEKKTYLMKWGNMPNGSIALHDGNLVAKFEGRAFLWSNSGYSRPIKTIFPTETTKVACLTPPSIRAILKSGYEPVWHPSAYSV